MIAALTFSRNRSLPVFAVVILAYFILVPPIAQDEAYHLFADARTIAGVPNFWNVVSNLPFALVGVVGLWKLRELTDRVLFAGVLFTCFGSAYYHWAPSDARLIWDRVPMAIIFASFAAYFLPARHPAPRLALLVTAGVGSVLWWAVTNDLRAYGIVKFGPVLLLLPCSWSWPDRVHLWRILGLFAFAQIAELSDQPIFSGAPVSGHTIKHLIAALATGCILQWRFVVSARASRDSRLPQNSIRTTIQGADDER